MNPFTIPRLPTVEQIQLAVRRYLEKAYGNAPERLLEQFSPAADADMATWLMRDEIERQPVDAGFSDAQAFCLRLGNQRYRYMKLRIARPPGKEFFVFTVDAHDAVLFAPPGSPDAAELEELKSFNARLSQEIMEEWDRCGVFTERAYLRMEIEQARHAQAQRHPGP